jgi:YidC/Oxa1 family membrane protein insertase
MDFMFTLFAPPLGLIMQGCYALTKDVGIAIILFTLVVRILMFPLTVKQQKTQTKAQFFAPRVREIQTRCAGNQAKMQEEMQKLQKEGYNPMGGCLPMILTMLILFGVLGVVYAPMSYFERIEGSEIEKIIELSIDIEHRESLEAIEGETDEEESLRIRDSIERAHYAQLRSELRAIGVYQDNKQAFREGGLKGETLEKLESLSERIVFMGMFDFSKIPTMTWPMILIPILSFLFASGQTVVMQVIQKKTAPEATQQMGQMKYMLYFMPIMSLVIAFQFPAGAGFYWTISAAVGIVQSLIIHKLWPPEKLREEVRATLEKQGFAAPDKIVVIEKHDGKTVSKKESEMSEKERKEYQRKKLAEARKADLEKYGEVGNPPPAEIIDEEEE